MGIFDFLFGKGTNKDIEKWEKRRPLKKEKKKVKNPKKDTTSKLTDDQKYWLGLVEMRVNAMDFDFIKRTYTVDSLGKDHFDEYTSNEFQVPEDKREEVALARVEGLLSIRDYIQSIGSKEQKFHLDSSIIGALIYAFSLGKHLNDVLLKYKKPLEKLKSDVVSNLYKQIGSAESNEKRKKELEKKKSKNSIENDNGFNRSFPTGKESGKYIECYKKDGILNGEYKMFNEDGVLVQHFEKLLPDGDGGFVADGKSREWDDDGLILFDVNFIRGKRDGFGVEYGEDGWIVRIDYYKDDEDVSWNSDKNKKMMLREIKKYMNDGVNVHPVQYIGLCESLGIDINEFSEKPDFII